jgi:hypothetical protein
MAVPMVGLEVIADDNHAVVQILDEGLNLVKTGVGKVEEQVKPGFYRARLITPEGAMATETVWLQEGRTPVTVPLKSPAPSTKTAVDLAKKAGFEIEPPASPLHSVAVFAIGAMAGASPLMLVSPTPGTVIATALAALATGMQLASVRGKTSTGLRILFAWDGYQGDRDQAISGLRLKIWEYKGDSPKSSVRLRPNPNLDAVAGYAREASPRSYWVRITSSELNIDWTVSTVVLPSLQTTLVLEAREDFEVGLSCLIARGNASDEKAELYLKQNLAQRALQSGRLDLAREYALASGESAIEDPVSACLRGYGLLASAKTSDASLGDFTNSIRQRYPSLSDAHLIWAAYRDEDTTGRDDVTEAFLQAARLGIPIFAEGLRRLTAACGKLSAVFAARSIKPEDQAAIDRLIRYRRALIRNQALTVLDTKVLAELESREEPALSGAR